MNIVLIGLPGSGKGTLGQRLAKTLGAEHISSGDLLRAEVRQGTLIGRKVSETLAQGGRVEDALITKMVLAKLSSLQGKPFILDGFPQTEAQMQALKEWGSLRFIVLKVNVETALARMCSRISCATCNAIFSSTSLQGSCQECGGTLEKRASDSAEKAAKRLAEYTLPPIPEEALQIDGNKAKDQIYQESLEWLGPKQYAAAL